MSVIKITCKTADRLPMDKLTSFQGELKTIDDTAMDKLKQSIVKYGFSFPVFVWKNNILDGHQRIEAVKRLMMDGYELKQELLPVVYIDAENRKEAAEKLLLINSRYAQIDQGGFETFAFEYGIEIPDMSKLIEIPEIDFDFESQQENEGLTDPDDVPEPPEEPITKNGDLWILGDHRLLCGDSTKIEDVERLMNGEKSILMQTDPPYGVSHIAAKDGIPRPGFSDMSNRWENIKNDDLEDEKLQKFLESVFYNAYNIALKNNAAWYLWHAHLSQGFFAAVANILLHRQIIWVKPSFVLSRSGMYHWKHEPCFYGWKKGNKPPWYGNKSQDTVWEIGRDKNGLHPTQKPVELWMNGIKNHTKKKEILFEPFSGSGSQIIAAEQTGRRCYAMEIDATYVQVAIKRWEDFTGKKAIKVDG